MRSVSSPSGVFPVRASFSILDSFYHLQVKFQPTSTIIFLVITMQLAISLISRNVCWNSVRAIYQGCWSGWRRLWSNNRQGSFRRWRSFCPSSNCNLCSGRSRYINRKIPRCIKCGIGRKREDNGVQEDSEKEDKSPRFCRCQQLWQPSGNFVFLLGEKGGEEIVRGVIRQAVNIGSQLILTTYSFLKNWIFCARRIWEVC